MESFGTTWQGSVGFTCDKGGGRLMQHEAMDYSRFLISIHVRVVHCGIASVGLSECCRAESFCTFRTSVSRLLCR